MRRIKIRQHARLALEEKELSLRKKKVVSKSVMTMMMLLVS